MAYSFQGFFIAFRCFAAGNNIYIRKRNAKNFSIFDVNFFDLESLFNLIEHTSRNIFLTGKAGTGKTTFLMDFVKKTRKKHIVVAPTGIAAINAGGVTIHSMFGLPLRTFVPTFDEIDRDYAMNITDLLPHFKYRRDKLKLLREVEIIIVDEVSMLRADVLDMMDLSLKHIRRNPLPFGGAQMLFIGDLYQLPPVVRQENERILSEYYATPFFFDAKAMQTADLMTIELKKVFRQKDETFLEVLNQIRDGDVENINFDLLNERYNPYFEPDEEAYVYLCSHNRMADEINRRKLEELPGKSYFYNAAITGDFKESQYPNDKELELKEGAQIMFIRNDTSSDKEYFNGKLAVVKDLSDEEITVVLDGSAREVILKKEKWEQKKYYLDNEKNIQEEILGSFEQYPIRLAWAVTIHKSQGLTFDRLIIDAGSSFASGQVYVALSRCRTLEGIVLKSKITPQVIFANKDIENFHSSTQANDKMEQVLQQEKYGYALQKVMRYINMRWMSNELKQWYDMSLKSKKLEKDRIEEMNNSIQSLADQLTDVNDKFEKIIEHRLKLHAAGYMEWSAIEEKVKGAVNFFFTSVNQDIFLPLKDLYAETKGEKGLKIYNAEFKVLLEDLQDYLNSLQTLYLLDLPLFDQQKESVKVDIKVEKIPSHVISYQLFEDGKTPEEITMQREISEATVYGHLARFAQQGVLDISRLFTQEKIENFKKYFDKANYTSLTEWKQALPDEYEFHEIRILLNHFNYLRGANRK